jgi:hypothetical protein
MCQRSSSQHRHLKTLLSSNYPLLPAPGIRLIYHLHCLSLVQSEQPTHLIPPVSSAHLVPSIIYTTTLRALRPALPGNPMELGKPWELRELVHPALSGEPGEPVHHKPAAPEATHHFSTHARKHPSSTNFGDFSKR